LITIILDKENPWDILCGPGNVIPSDMEIIRSRSSVDYSAQIKQGLAL
jgi:hypothetical protein